MKRKALKKSALELEREAKALARAKNMGLLERSGWRRRIGSRQKAREIKAEALGIHPSK